MLIGHGMSVRLRMMREDRKTMPRGLLNPHGLHGGQQLLHGGGTTTMLGKRVTCGMVGTSETSMKTGQNVLVKRVGGRWMGADLQKQAIGISMD